MILEKNIPLKLLQFEMNEIIVIVKDNFQAKCNKYLK